MTKKITLLHTAPANVATFERLARSLAPEIPVQHILDESLLADARSAGSITPELTQRIQAQILSADEESAVVLCTCSTIGGAAEQLRHPTAGAVQRVDRAMAERAVELGRRIVVMAALASTLGPTRQLILDVAQQLGKDVELSEVLCNEAWSKFEQGDTQAYYAMVAACVRQNAERGDVIVLAQASMAGGRRPLHGRTDTNPQQPTAWARSGNPQLLGKGGAASGAQCSGFADAFAHQFGGGVGSRIHRLAA
jgi:hypothetical protein